MQLTNLPILVMATVLAFGDTASADAWCHDSFTPLYQKYEVKATEVPASDIPAICGGLWSNLKRFASCGATGTFCGTIDGFPTTLTWRFNAPWGCNHGMVHSAWWEATQNKWGGISCVNFGHPDP
ncbi:uncharacterized protein B0H64DRAFT_46262 [Chaetomium fimeti]|uniref:Uncharacterized protein n=1 Tax=Chaetomium fimeti TaxID=1854472 RepID=A0AAE0H7L5_9PEZI|nr:hypothetical protein B0H64DRAFT_46262 [Chaetomium fimeti]